MLRRFAPAALALLALAAPPHVGAQDDDGDAQVLRLATLMPRNRRARRLLGAWNRTLQERTDGRVSVRVYWGGAMGDERTMVRRMRIAQLDAASLTSTGLGIIHRPVLVMQMPGVFRSYAQVDAVRAQVGPELSQAMQGEGFHLLGWGDAGRVRLFSRSPVRRPTDLRHMRPWVPRSDAVFRQMLSVVGANGVPLAVGEVYGSLRTGVIDVVPGTAIAAIGLQWHTSIRHVTAQNDGFLVGGMVVRSAWLDDLRPDDRRAFLEVSRESRERLIQGARRADERAYDALVRHGVDPVDVEAHRDEWERAAAQTRQRLAGRLFPPALLERVERIAAAAR
ncbi:MAG TPA: TRAP transporter substrate-binding protein DctP [Sandaracinaceae bacterium LLY-WYZ-13_1]|nr:TRAP transporter substrate-binding protein DctP [Sandaracinaceae bacterium LLY-WYZ-13_1]